ncbi:HAMP domain-containing sensor histidine kinase [uncultured Pelagimonas sp.]|uniref:sensor histidine kinase n=1 Tax=uncultured Pelagimonas sp. TaxID=1618102 RepID=UPI002612EBD0|nr:HAMP domain-containing sensor histidine kinase [uncultured Pelagimonas sp.]
MTGKWRPSLGFVIGGALTGTLVLSLIGLVALRYLGPEIGFRQAAVVLAILIAIITAVPGWLLVRLLVRPIYELESYAKGQEAGQNPPAPQHFGTKEIDATARGVITMAEALRDRETTIRAYTDHVTHELKTPVSAIRAATELLEDNPNLSSEDRVLVAQIDGARRQLELQLSALRNAAQARETRYLGHCTLEDLAEDLHAQNPKMAIKITGGDTALPIAPEGLHIVLTQLLGNAQEHGADKVTLVADRNYVLVEDNGQGVSKGNASRIFEPFFTTKRDSGGTGMGLSVARNILQAHRGDLHLEPNPNGARFKITFGG